MASEKPFYVSQLPEGVQNKLKDMQKKKLLDEGYSEKEAEYYADEFLNEKIYTAEEFYGNNFWERPEFKEESKSLDAIKDNFTPPAYKGHLEEENPPDTTITVEDEERFGKDALSGLTGPRESEQLKDAVDTNDNGKIEVDEMADFQKSLDDYAAKNKKGRDDIPVTTRR